MSEAPIRVIADNEIIVIIGISEFSFVKKLAIFIFATTVRDMKLVKP